MSVYLGRVAAQDQDAAGQGIYSALTTMFFLVVGGLALGLPALRQARRDQQVSVWAHVAAWFILLSPVLVAGGVILFELIW